MAFTVSLLGLDVAHVDIVTRPFQNDRIETSFRSYTLGGFHKMYDIDNSYHFFTDMAGDSLLYYYKRIHQKDFEQYYFETVGRDSLTYHKNWKTVPVDAPVQHILSFLIYLQSHPAVCRGEIPLPDILISDEGELLKPEIRIHHNNKKQQHEVYFILTRADGEELLKDTDIFNWKACAGKAERMAAYSYKDNSLTEAAFSLGLGIHLRAKKTH